MSSEHGEKRTRIQAVPQNSFSDVLKKLTDKETLKALQQAAQESANTSISICQSSGEDDADTFYFIADTASKADIPALAEQLEDILEYEKIEFIDNSIDKTLIAPENEDRVKAFITEAEVASKKHKK